MSVTAGLRGAAAWLGRYRVPVGLLAVVVLLRPVLADPLVLGYGQVANTVLVWMLFAVSFNLLLGYAGLLSFGHALFFGTGVYVVAIGVRHVHLPGLEGTLPFVPAALLGIGLAAAGAHLVGRLIADRGEIYFAMLTLAFAETVHFLVNKNYGGFTGGSAGLPVELPGWLESQRGVKYVTAGPLEFEWYYLVAAVVFVGALAVWQLVRSPFGRTLVVVRENEQLARAIGIDARRYKIWAFTASGAVAALAGALLVLNNQTASLSTLSIEASGDVIMMSVLGGTNYFVGPIAGVLAWMTSEEFLTGFEALVLPLAEVPLVRLELAEVLAYWQFFLGGLFVLVVLVAPHEGLWGFLRRQAGRVGRPARRVLGAVVAPRGGDRERE